ncbi:MAG: hypothetical protein Q9228_007678, partial [Teloschistes exilis]
MDDSSKGFLKSIEAYYREGRFTDLTITCRGRDYYCHKLVVCTQSKFFEAACTHGFTESVTSKVDLSTEEPYLINLMLEDLYTQGPLIDSAGRNEPDILSEVMASLHPPSTQISLYALGDRLIIAGLCKYAARLFKDWIESADLRITDMASWIPLLYDSLREHGRTLRNLVIERLLAPNLECENAPSSEPLSKLMGDIEQFREDIFVALWRNIGPYLDSPDIDYTDWWM